MNRAVFLDRDNTLITADPPPTDPDHVQLIQGAASAVGSLRGLAYRIIVVSNQPAVADGSLTEPQVDAIHQRIAEQARRTAASDIDRFYYCPYESKAKEKQFRRDHPWQMPQPGMLQQAAEDLDLDLAACWAVGATAAIVQAGNAAGARTILLTSAPRSDTADLAPDFTAANLVEAVRLIAQHVKPDAGADLMTDSPDARSPHPMPSPIAAPVTDAVADPPGSDDAPADRTARTSRPFRPWSIQPVLDEDEPEPAPDPHVEAPAQSPQSQPVAAEPTADPPPAPAPPEQPPVSALTETPPPPARSVADSRTDDLLSDILRQVKTRNVEAGDFSLFKLSAMLMQLFAIACVALGVLNTDDPALFTRFLLGAIFLQLAVITLLIADWKK